MRKPNVIKVPGVSVIFPADDTSMTLSNMSMTCVCSYFDGDMSEEDKQKIEIKSEEEEEEVSSGQKKATHKSQR